MGAGYALYEDFPLVKGEPQITNYNGYRADAARTYRNDSYPD